MIHIITILAVLAIGFGLGRTKHFDNLIAKAKAIYSWVRGKV